jgi:hypothetical protein
MATQPTSQTVIAKPSSYKGDDVMKRPNFVVKEIEAEGQVYEDRLVKGLALSIPAKRVNYRKLAFEHYEQLGQLVCAHCGFGIRDVLEVAHLDGDRSNNELINLAILCPNCHKMHDLDLISTATILDMRDRPKIVIWAKRMKDAGAKAAETRRISRAKLKRSNAAKKAALTRRQKTAVNQFP